MIDVMTAYLYLLKGNLKAETFVKVWIQSVFLDCCLFLLDAFSILL